MLFPDLEMNTLEPGMIFSRPEPLFSASRVNASESEVLLSDPEPRTSDANELSGL
jgi:hypothetical protein